MIPLNIGKRIKYYREVNNFTQQDLADKVGITYEMVSRYERGTSQPYRRLKDLAKALNVELSELLQNTDSSGSSSLIPLFTKMPNSFHIENTHYFYTCPTWIIEKDKKAFAIDMGLINDEEDGVFYVSTKTKPKENSFVLFKKANGLKIEKFENQKNILGVVLGKEIRLF